MRNWSRYLHAFYLGDRVITVVAAPLPRSRLYSLVGAVAAMQTQQEKLAARRSHLVATRRRRLRDAASPESDMGLVSRVSPVQTALRNCTRDEGRSFEVGFGAKRELPACMPSKRRPAKRSKGWEASLAPRRHHHARAYAQDACRGPRLYPKAPQGQAEISKITRREVSVLCGHYRSFRKRRWIVARPQRSSEILEGLAQKRSNPDIMAVTVCEASAKPLN